LLAEVTDWAYGSDGGLNRTALIDDAESVVEERDISKSLANRFR